MSRVRWSSDEEDAVVAGLAAAEISPRSDELLRIIRKVQVEVLPLSRRRTIVAHANLRSEFYEKLEAAFKQHRAEMLVRHQAEADAAAAAPEPAPPAPPQEPPKLTAAEIAGTSRALPACINGAAPAAPPAPAPSVEPAPPPSAIHAATRPALGLLERFVEAVEGLSASAELAVELLAAFRERAPAQASPLESSAVPPPLAPEPAKARPRAVVLGCNEDQRRVIEHAIGGRFELATHHHWTPKSLTRIEAADLVIAMTKYLSPATETLLRRKARGEFRRVSGGAPDVISALSLYAAGRTRANGVHAIQ